MENQNNLGKIIKRHRESNKWSLNKLADEMDNLIDQSYLWRLEKGDKTNPSWTVLLKLVEVLNIDLREILLLYDNGHLLNRLYDREISQSKDIYSILRENNVHYNLTIKEDTNVTISLGLEEKEELASIVNKILNMIGSNSTLEQLPRLLESIIELEKVHKKNVSNQMKSQRVLKE